MCLLVFKELKIRVSDGRQFICSGLTNTLGTNTVSIFIADLRIIKTKNNGFIGQ